MGFHVELAVREPPDAAPRPRATTSRRPERARHRDSCAGVAVGAAQRTVPTERPRRSSVADGRRAAYRRPGDGPAHTMCDVSAGPDHEARAALARWRDFPVTARPRPTVLPGDPDWTERGFVDGPSKMAYGSGVTDGGVQRCPSPTAGRGTPSRGGAAAFAAHERLWDAVHPRAEPHSRGCQLGQRGRLQWLRQPSSR